MVSSISSLRRRIHGADQQFRVHDLERTEWLHRSCRSEFSFIFDRQSDFFIAHIMINYLFKTNLLQVQDNFSYIFANTFDGGKLMVCAFNVDTDDCITFQ